MLFSLIIPFVSDIREAKVTLTPGKFKIEISGSMLIDYLSVRNLELVQNLHNPKSPQSLFGVLDHCHSSMGKRLLRANILQPSSGNPI